MKLLKYLLILIGVVVLGWLIASFMGPKNYKVIRSAVINANDSIVFNYVSRFQNWNAWSPWHEKDPSAHYSIAGVDGTVGAVNSWDGGVPEITGTGSMTLTEVTPNKKVSYDLAFTEPWQMNSHGGFELEPAGENKTKLSWYDQGDIEFSQRAMMLFMNLDDMMGPDFDRGLAKIDSLATIAQAAMNTPAE